MHVPVTSPFPSRDPIEQNRLQTRSYYIELCLHNQWSRMVLMQGPRSETTRCLVYILICSISHRCARLVSPFASCWEQYPLMACCKAAYRLEHQEQNVCVGQNQRSASVLGKCGSVVRDEWALPKEWERYRHIIAKLYLDEDMQLKQVMVTMHEAYGHKGT
jgi:hypothetical protein